MCLVFGEGIALKAPKIQRYTRNLDEVDWPWLQDLIDGNYGDSDGDDSQQSADSADGSTGEGDTVNTEENGESADENPAAASESTDSETDAAEVAGPPRAKPSKKFLQDLIAGRPVFSHPSEHGGFRLRYGRARNHGHATAGVHPATMHLVDDFLATGTQIKTERPGKAAGVVPVDTIEGPTVRLANGDVRQINDIDEALAVRNGVKRILDLGEYLVNYGEFIENNHDLAPASYVFEWWVQEFEEAGAPVQALDDSTEMDLEHPSPSQAIAWAMEYDAPLHPDFTYLWHDISVEQLSALAEAIEQGEVTATDGATDQPTSVDRKPATDQLVLPRDEVVTDALEQLLIEHTQHDDSLVIPTWRPLVRTLGFDAELGPGDATLTRNWTLDDLSDRARTYADGENAIQAISEIAPFTVRERAPTRIGNRMGRPEKSEERELSPAVHTLFPIGEAGGNQRSLEKAAKHGDSVQGTEGHVDVEVGRRECVSCETRTYRPRCPECGDMARAVYLCPDCGREVEPDESGRAECPRCEVLARPTEYTTLDIKQELAAAKKYVGERAVAYDTLKGVKGLTSKEKTPEPIEKGILRAKHDISAFKDGTVRYDMTDLPVTAVRPSELDVTVDAFRGLGYHEDIRGDPLQHDDQLVELRVQDIVLSDGAAEHMLKTADFVDDLLSQYYGLEPYYELDEREDLIGELVFGMAPHTSAATVGRIVGFTSAAVGYAHPYFHAAKRRNCFHPETKLWYENEDGEWRYRSIESLVEPRLTDPETDDFGTEIESVDGEIRVPSLDSDGNLVPKPVSALSKHPAPDHLVRVQTRNGRTVTVTPDHTMQTYDGGSLTTKRASELTETDSLVTPNRLNLHDENADTTAFHRFDLLREFIACDSIDNRRLMIKGLAKDRLYTLFEERLADDWDGPFYPLKSTAEYFGLSHKTLSNYLYRGSFPAKLLAELFESRAELLAFVPEDVTLGMKHDRVQMDRYVELNERVATLLGYYAAEGFAREQTTPKGTIHQTTLCGTEDEAREFFMSAFEEEFGTEPYRESDTKITVSGRLVRTFFDTVLDCGIYAETKRVPQCIFGAGDEVIAAYLRGYFSGDGGVKSSSLSIEATTVSTELKEDILALLTRIGISAQVSETEPVQLAEKFPDHYDENDSSLSAPTYVLTISSDDAVTFAETVGFQPSRKTASLENSVSTVTPRGSRTFTDGSGQYLVEPVDSVEYVESESSATYCVTVPDTHSLVVSDTIQKQCDGDEDCVMLLMDGLLNFSESFLPNQRGGKMDAPLVMSSRIDPAEIDDEAHNIDIMETYPREFYEATREMQDPSELEDIMTIIEENLGTDREYTNFAHTHDTTDIAAGPDLSAYKTLGSMKEKMDAQLALSRKLRAVDETDVAERIIEYHFLPDLLGNLKAFSSQEFRCLGCGEKYRRAPLTSDCRHCGGDVSLTVHEGSVNKYMDTAIHVADEFGCREYTKQRLEILETRINRIFEDDTNKQSGIADFM